MIICMEIVSELKIVLFLLWGLGAIAIIIFIVRKNSPDTDYYKIIAELNEQEKKDLKTLEEGNKEIERIEKEILECKKKLGFKLFKKSK